MSAEETKTAPEPEKKAEEKKKYISQIQSQLVFIETVRQLKCGEEGANVDPIVEVECCKDKKYTTGKNDIAQTSVVHWNEHLFFEPKNLSVEDIEQAKVSLRVMDKGLLKNSLIGTFEFDVAFIYFMPQHTMLHTWIVLSDPNSPCFEEVTGYMKLSISVATGGDEQVQITEDVSGSDAESAMMPPQIKPQFFQLKFRFFKAEKLPIMDMALFGRGGSIDAYVKTTYMKKKLKTKTYTMKNETVLWDQEFLIPQSLPIMTGKIKMEVYDEDRISDEIVGSIMFSAKEIVGRQNGQFSWKNIYGAPASQSNDNAKLMNHNPELASTWKGRILMQVLAEQVDKPEINCLDLDEEVAKSAEPYMEDHEFEIIAEVGLGISLPSDKKYTVKIRIADFELRTDKPAAAESTFNRWNKRFPVTVFTCPYQDVYDLGKVFIYLMEGEKPICFAKDDIENFLDPNAKIKWYELLPDTSIGKVKDYHKAGIVSFKMSVNDKTKNGSVDFSKFAAWKKPPPKRPMNKKVRAYLFQCRDLPAADDDGSSDPYVCIWDTNKTMQKTKYIEDNVNPLFYITMELMYEANSNNISDMPPFVIDVYDKDFGFADGDDFLCRSIIYIEDAAVEEGDKVPIPKWHPCRLKQGAPPSGEVLISFSIVDDDFNFKVPLPYMTLTDFVKFEEFTVECNVLGLRDLQSVGIMPVKKAYIQFNLKSLLPPDNAQAIENIQTQPGPAGSDPTINTLISFSCPLPIDSLYCPRLSCIVFDNIFKGFMQPLMGTFTIPVGDILQMKFKQRAEEKNTFLYLIQELEKIISDEGILSYCVTEQASEVDDEEFRVLQAQEKEEMQKQFALTLEEKEETPYDAIETKRQDSLKQPLMCMDYMSDEDEDTKKSMTKKAKVSPSYQEEEKGPTRSPNKEPETILSQSEIKENWFRRLWNSVIRRKIGEQLTEAQKKQRLSQAQRERDASELLRNHANLAFRTIVRPEYELDERLNAFRECNMPPESLYIALGWDETPEQNRKHYRKFYPDELENVRDVMPTPSPFDQYDIKRGQSRGASKSMFSFKAKEDESGAVTTEKVVGKFKGLINIVSEAERPIQLEERRYWMETLSKLLNKVSYKRTRKPLNFKSEQLDTHNGRMKFRVDLENLGLAHLQIHSHLQKLTFEESLKRMLMAQNQCIVRIYVISAFDLASRDIGSASDPYLFISLGNKNYNERKNYQDDEPNPDFYKMFEFEATFPGCPMLNLQIYDYDDLFGDDLIGETKIDLEDRFFSPDWQSLKYKPVEYRQLYHQSSACSQGQVKCWVEIVDKNDIETEIFDIQKKPPDHFEVRVCVLDTLDVKAMDDDGCSDVFIKCFFNQKDGIKETDTHFRCQDGRASFNYRMLLNFEHPKKLKNQYDLTIQAFDRDFFKSNDIIGEVRLSLFNLIEDCALTNRPISLSQKYYDSILKNKGISLKFKDENSFFVDIIGSGFDKKGKREITGKIRLQIDIYPKEQAVQNKVGEARQEPNCNPYLAPPIGRLSFSMNPFKMFTQLVGPRLRRKLYCYCCIILCCAMCLTMLPIIVADMMASLLNPFS